MIFIHYSAIVRTACHGNMLIDAYAASTIKRFTFYLKKYELLIE